MRARGRYGVEYVASTILVAREGGIYLALIDAHAAGLIERSHQRRVHVRRVARGMFGRNLPLDRHPVERSPGLIPGVSDDCDAAAEDAAARQRRIGNRELDGRPDAGHRANRVEVVRLHVAPVHRARCHGSPLHSGQPNVDSVNSLSRHLVGDVEIFLLGPHQRPLGGRLDGDRLGMRMRRVRGALRDLAVGCRAAARCVRDDTILRGQLCGRHVPLLRSSEQQPFARFSAGKLQVIPAVLD